MGSDPYGFPEASASGGSADDAVIALWTGVGALICGALGPCLCYAPWLLALPLSAAALWYGVRARSAAAAAGPGLEHAANAGIVSGSVALVLALTFLLGIAAYALIVVFAIASEI